MTVTICIPTKDRSHFLSRLLRYYGATGYRHQIFIADSSGQTHAERNKRTIESLRHTLNIRRFECPGLGSNGALEQLSESISTPYCVAIPDDDFVSSSGIDRCVQFLDRNPDYSFAHGLGFILSTDRDGPHGNIKNVIKYPQAVLGAATGSDRLSEYFGRSLYAMFFSVLRTSDYRDLFTGFATRTGDRLEIPFDELTISAVGAIRGKVKELDGLHLVRHTHRASAYEQFDAFAWITDPRWQTTYRLFHDRLVKELVREDGVSLEAAAETVKRAFWPHLARQLTGRWEIYCRRFASSDGRPESSKLRSAARRVPGLRPLKRRFFPSRKPRHPNEIPLAELLSPSSPYHKDFMPIYRAVTAPPVEE